jgi:hypothetical protein
LSHRFANDFNTQSVLVINRRDKNATKGRFVDYHLDHDAHVLDYRHQFIPRDADGNPVFLILPATWKAKLDEDLDICRAAWVASEPLAVAEAVTGLRIHRQPPPTWVEEAVIQLATNRRDARQAERYREARRHYLRFQYVQSLRADGLPLARAKKRAAELLEKIGAAASASTVLASYKRVKRDFRAGRGLGKYIFYLKDRRYRHLGK